MTGKNDLERFAEVWSDSWDAKMLRLQGFERASYTGDDLTDKFGTTVLPAGARGWARFRPDEPDEELVVQFVADGKSVSRQSHFVDGFFVTWLDEETR